MSSIRNNVGDKIVVFPLVDKSGNDINFSDAQEAIFQFWNKAGQFIQKLKSLNEVIEGSEPNYFQVELQEIETVKLGKEQLTVYIEVTLLDSQFSDGEVTSNTEVKIDLWDV